jgi:hypothetical protein
MSDDQDGTGVGYRRPPVETRFKKGRSGNPAGRPRKRGVAPVDLAAILDTPIPVRQGGEARMMSPREISLRKMLKNALADDFKALVYLLELFTKHGMLSVEQQVRGGVLPLPSTMPFPMAFMMLTRFGPPPWKPRQIAAGRTTYLQTRSDRQKLEDEAVGYPNL